MVQLGFASSKEEVKQQLRMPLETESNLMMLRAPANIHFMKDRLPNAQYAHDNTQHHTNLSHFKALNTELP